MWMAIQLYEEKVLYNNYMGGRGCVAQANANSSYKAFFHLY